MMSKVFAYLDHIFRMVRPRRLLYMAIDGVAPRAKMNQQRSRRFRSALEAEKLKAEAAAKGEPEASGDPFDSNCITPGTPFMARLSEHLKFYVLKKQTEDPLWQKATVILSGHEVRGEGEHKIMEHIRWARGEPGWDPNQTHCLHGLDADLIMLALVTHEPHFCLLREVVKFGAGANSGQPSRETLQNPTDDGFLLLHVGLLREYLDQEFRGIADALPFEYDCERVVDDFVLLSMLVGNDFLPPLPTLDIAEGALNTLFATYRELLPSPAASASSGDDGGGRPNAARLRVLEVMGEMEARVLALRLARRGGQRGAPGAQGERWARVRGRDKKAKDAGGPGKNKAAFRGGRDEVPRGDGGAGRRRRRRRRRRGGGGAPRAGAERRFGHLRGPHDDVRGEARDVRGGRRRHRGLEGDVLSREARAESRRGAASGGVAPGVLRGFVLGPAVLLPRRRVVDLVLPVPLRAHGLGLGGRSRRAHRAVRLRRAFPPVRAAPRRAAPQSSALLPEPFRWLILRRHSPLASFFPDELKVDFEGKRNDWEGVVLLPFLDEHLLKQCIASVPASKLTEAQIARNKPGSLVVFRHAPDGTGTVASTLPRAFPGLHPCKSEAFESMPPGEFPVNRKCFGGTDCLLPGVQTGVKRPPGFPTMHTLRLPRRLEERGGERVRHGVQEGVADFEGGQGWRRGAARHRGRLPRRPSAAAYAHLVGRRVHIGWPYLREAAVTAVSDRREKILARGQRAPHGASEWGAAAQKTSHELLVTRRRLRRRRRDHPLPRVRGLGAPPRRVAAEARFGKTDNAVPAQLCSPRTPTRARG